MTRRSSERHSKRLEVHFWRRGSPQPHTGYTVDLSRTGLYLTTAMQLSPGERIRLEVVDQVNGFVVEGEVARIFKVAVALRHVQQPGVGVRFLPPPELVGSLIRSDKPKSGSMPPSEPLEIAVGALEPELAGATQDEPAAVEVTVPPATISARPDMDELFGDDPAPLQANEEASSAAAAVPAVQPPLRAQKTVAVEFVDRSSFLSVYSRDIAAGGLFVTTKDLVALHSTVTIEIRPPVAVAQPLRFEARVVHRFEGGGGGEGQDEMIGIGVQFFDPESVRLALAPVLAELRK